MNQNSINKELDRFNDLISQNKISEYNNLSKVKELVAKYKGFDNWYQLEKYFSIKDKQINSLNKNIDMDMKLFSTYAENIIYSQNDVKKYFKEKNYPIKDKKDIPCVIGIDKNKNFLRNKKYYTINNYPLYVEGVSGSGITEVMLTMSFQNIENNEGVIFVDHKGDNSLYSKIYSFCSQTDRLDDLYILNLMLPSNFHKNNEDNKLLQKNIHKKLGHSINPFNILITDKNIFTQMFGEKTTYWLYPYLSKCINKNEFISLEYLITLFSFKTLFNMRNNDLGNQVEVTNYLSEIGLSENVKDDNDLIAIAIKHMELNYKAIEFIEMIKVYVEDGIFSDEAEIDLEYIFSQRKILVVLHSYLEKIGDEHLKLSNLINTLIYVAEKNTRKYDMHFQNIYFISTEYALLPLSDENDLKKTKNKYVFTFSSYLNLEKVLKYYSPNNKLTFNSFSSFLLMKGYEKHILHKYLFFKYHNGTDINSFFKDIMGQSPGEGYFIDILNMNSYDALYKKSVLKINFSADKPVPYVGEPTLLNIRCLYFSPKRTNFIRIIDHKNGE